MNSAHAADHEELGYDDCPELAVVALLTMMSAFPQRQSAAIADSVLAHLYCVCASPRVEPALRACAADLMEIWRGYRDLATMPTDATLPQ